VKVLIVNDYGPLAGGAERASLILRDGLRTRGHDARLFATTAQPVAGDNPADYTCYGTDSNFRRGLQVMNLSAAMRLRRILSDFQPDTVHVRMFMTQMSPLILPELRRFPSLLHLNNYQTVCPLNTRILPDGSSCRVRAGRPCYDSGCVSVAGLARTALQLAAWRRWRNVFQLLIANSQGLADELAFAGLQVDDVILNGASDRAAQRPLSDPPTIAYAGRLVEKKGVEILLHALSILRQKKIACRLLVAGDGPQRRRIESVIAELDLSGHVSMLGHRSSDELETAVAGAWVLAVPSIYQEPFANTAVEAMMQGMAVVASSVGGIKEIVRDECTGLLVPPADPAALATALERILSDREIAERMGAAGRAVALADFSENRMVDRFVTVYRGMTASLPIAGYGARRSQTG